MIRAFCLLLLPALALAQSLQQVVKQGEDIFAKTCAAGYCHGPKGSGTGAPRLSGRGFDQAYITNTVMRGVRDTAMAAFANGLPRPELIAVIAYVSTLNGIVNPNLNVGGGPGGAVTDAGPPLSPEGMRGQERFSDAVLGFNRCSVCHEVNGIGIAVAKPIENIPADASALRNAATPDVTQIPLDGELMFSVVVRDSAKGSLLYDLTTRPPVLRSLPGLVPRAQAAVKTPWDHAAAIASYNDSDLNDILAYLRAVAKP